MKVTQGKYRFGRIPLNAKQVRAEQRSGIMQQGCPAPQALHGLHLEEEGCKTGAQLSIPAIILHPYETQAAKPSLQKGSRYRGCLQSGCQAAGLSTHRVGPNIWHVPPYKALPCS